MKTVIELLEKAYENVFRINRYRDARENFADRETACRFIQQAIAELKSPRWYTPEQWEKRTGKAWPEDWAVYARAKYVESGWSRWGTLPYSESKLTMYKTQIVCATEAGPPPDDWRPEEER
jgi:hypothetical protein